MAGRTSVCLVSGKRRFRDHRQAVRVLHNAARCRREAAWSGLGSNRRECRSYLCDWCNGWHLTSKEEWVIFPA